MWLMLAYCNGTAKSHIKCGIYLCIFYKAPKVQPHMIRKQKIPTDIPTWESGKSELLASCITLIRK